MARFDVFLNRGGQGFLLDVQADLLDHFRTRVVVPLLTSSQAPPSIVRLNPIFSLGEHRLVMATHLLSVVPASALKDWRGSLKHHHDEIVGALDMLFQGF